MLLQKDQNYGHLLFLDRQVAMTYAQELDGFFDVYVKVELRLLNI